MDDNTITILFIIIIMWLVYLTFRDNKSYGIEDFTQTDVANEAIQNLASDYNSGNMTVTNLTVTGDATITGNATVSGTVTNTGITNAINSKQPTGNYVKYDDTIRLINGWGWNSYLNTYGNISDSGSSGSQALGVYSTKTSERINDRMAKWKIVA